MLVKTFPRSETTSEYAQFPILQPLATVFRAVVFFPTAEVLLHAVAVLCALLRAGNHVPFLNGTSAVVEVDIDRAHIE